MYNRGYGGYNTRWARELAPALFARPPQGQAHLLATVWFGANDACISTERAHVPLLVSVAHRETLYAYHTHVLACSEGAVWSVVPMAEWLATRAPTTPGRPER